MAFVIPVTQETKNKMPIVLGIETSCDETGVAIYHSKRGILGHALSSQTELHAMYGGVVPEVSARDHIQKTLPLIRQALDDAKLSLSDITAIAYTAGPGLIGALMVGASTACTLAYSLDIPAIPIHHLEGHLLIALLEKRPAAFPFIALLVSGGHTQLISVDGVGQYRILGETLDDAVGEAFDKTAKLLGLGYPGGPALEALATKGKPSRFALPRPMTDRPGLDFSFSGLKTAVAQAWADSDKSEITTADIAASFQAAAVDTLVIKCKRALQSTGLCRLVVAGGVAANTVLRESLERMTSREDADVFFPQSDRCTDNGIMIAYAGYLRLQKAINAKQSIEWDLSIIAQARWRL